MADKEERIYIGMINPEGDSCPVPYGTCNSLCDNCKGGMTRQEAIGIISNALINFKYSNTASAEDIDECEKEAEICVNALLGIEK